MIYVYKHILYSPFITCGILVLVFQRGVKGRAHPQKDHTSTSSS